MNATVLELKKSGIEPCESIIIKDPYYERDVWCAFQVDNCSRFTHAKALVSNYDEHYKDDKFEFDMNNTDFALILGTEDFVSSMYPRTDEDNSIGIGSTIDHSKCDKKKTEIGCDTAQFSFGNENTFGAFSIHTGADGGIGEVHLYTVKGSGLPIGLFFIGSVDGDMVSPEELMNSFKAAFGIDREKDRSLQNRIDNAEQKKGDVPQKGSSDKENVK